MCYKGVLFREAVDGRSHTAQIRNCKELSVEFRGYGGKLLGVGQWRRAPRSLLYLRILSAGDKRLCMNGSYAQED